MNVAQAKVAAMILNQSKGILEDWQSAGISVADANDALSHTLMMTAVAADATGEFEKAVAEVYPFIHTKDMIPETAVRHSENFKGALYGDILRAVLTEDEYRRASRITTIRKYLLHTQDWAVDLELHEEYYAIEVPEKKDPKNRSKLMPDRIKLKIPPLEMEWGSEKD